MGDIWRPFKRENYRYAWNDHSPITEGTDEKTCFRSIKRCGICILTRTGKSQNTARNARTKRLPCSRNTFIIFGTNTLPPNESEAGS